MSIELNSDDFAKQRDHLLRSATPVPYRVQQAWLADWNSAAARMKYLKVEHSSINDALRCLLRLTGRLKRPNLNIDFVKPDVVNLWIEICDEAQFAAHCLRNVEHGFEFSFMAVEEESYVTGMVSVFRYQVQGFDRRYGTRG